MRLPEAYDGSVSASTREGACHPCTPSATRRPARGVIRPDPRVTSLDQPVRQRNCVVKPFDQPVKRFYPPVETLRSPVLCLISPVRTQNPAGQDTTLAGQAFHFAGQDI